LQLLFGGREIYPTFEGLRGQRVAIIIEEFLYNGTGPFELLCMPQKCAACKKITVGGHRFLLIQSYSQGIDGFLIDISASLMIID